MDEKETNKGAETTTETEGTGVQSETITELDRADQIAERQARENERREKILDREEALAARKAVGGVSEAGQQPVKKEVDDEQYAKDVLSGKITNDKKE